jgi:hypothetical protein
MAEGIQLALQYKQQDGGVDGVRKRTKDGAFKVGLNAGLGEHPSSDDGTTIPEVGAKNEFGIGIPERSFIRSTIAENINKYNKLRREMIAGIILGKITSEKAIAVLGEELKKDIQAKIVAFSEPGNSEATIAIKGVDNPLIDTGTMRQSIQWEAIK